MAPPIPIAMLITELGVGGAERCLVRLATDLPGTQFSPVVYSLAPPPAEGRDQLVDQLREAGIPARFVGVRHAWQLPLAVTRLRNWWRSQHPRVIQSFLHHANVTGALAASAAPDAALVQGVRVADPSRIRQRMAGWAARRAAGVVCVSQSVAEHCVEKAGIPSGKLRVIPNGVDLPAGIEPIRRAALGVGDGQRLLVYVGRLDSQKGLDWLLECLPPMFERFSDCDLVLVGDGPERQRLHGMVAVSGLSDRVHFTGWRAEIPQILAAATAFVLPSRWEGMPNALLEAMASGLPVASTRAEGVVEILGDLAESQSAEFGDRVAFGRCLSGLLEDPAAAVALGRANRERVAAKFSWSRSIERYVRLYRELASDETGAA